MKFVKPETLQTAGSSLYSHVRVSTRSANPVALIAATRHQLRRAGVAKEEIRRFSDEAFSSENAASQVDVCRRWVDVSQFCRHPGRTEGAL